MTALPVLASIIAAGALWPPWPFGGEDSQDSSPTIQDLESPVVEIEPNTAISNSQAKAMESYQLFIDLADNDPVLQAEAMRRLADLQLEAGELEQLQQNLRVAEALPGDAIHLYERLLTSYPDYVKNDLVLYQLARAYELGGQQDEALAALDKLVDDHPDTLHLAEAHFRRGELLFSQRRYQQAEQAYGAVLAAADTRFSEQSLYKHGWAIFKQTRHEDSLGSFFQLLDLKFRVDQSDSDPAAVYLAMSRAERELIDDALRVLSISFAYLDGPTAVTDYFKMEGARSYTYIVYTKLGDLYLEKERYQDAAAAYLAFADLDVHHSKAPNLKAEAIEAYIKGGFPGLTLAAKESFAETYGSGSPYWDQYSYQEQPEVVAYLKSHLSDLAAFHHSEAQTTSLSEHYQAAARWYGDYLVAFPGDPDSANINFLLAEVLYESEDYLAATSEYETTAYEYAMHDSAAEAGYAALLAYNQHELLLEDIEKEQWHRQSINSALRFSSQFPDHPEAAPALTDAAERLFNLDDLGAAKEAARAMLSQYPDSDPALRRTAWRVVAHSEFDQGYFASAETAYSQLNTLIPAEDEELTQIDERIASSIYKQAEQARDNGDYQRAVSHFLRIADITPNSRIVTIAQYDAAAALITLNEWSRATGILETFRRDNPGHDLTSDVTAKLAVAYIELGDDARAANEFERIADGSGLDEVRKEALWRAAELYRSTGDLEHAASSLERYIDRYPQPVEFAAEALQQLVELAEERGDYPARMGWLEAVVSADAQAGAERSDRTRSLAAYAALELAKPTRDAFAAITLSIPLQESLQTKISRMESALAAYGKAVDYGIADVTTAATYEIAELYHALSRDLLDSERPSNLSALELGQYDLLLEEQAYPFEEQAIDLHEINAARTAEGIYDDAVKQSLTALATLVPGRYAKYEMGEQLVAAIY